VTRSTCLVSLAPEPHARRPGETRATNRPSWATSPRFRGCWGPSSVSSRHTAMKLRRNRPRSQPVVRVARFVGPLLAWSTDRVARQGLAVAAQPTWRSVPSGRSSTPDPARGRRRI